MKKNEEKTARTNTSADDACTKDSLCFAPTSRLGCFNRAFAFAVSSSGIGTAMCFLSCDCRCELLTAAAFYCLGGAAAASAVKVTIDSLSFAICASFSAIFSRVPI